MNENTNMASPKEAGGSGGRDWHSAYDSGETPWDKGIAHPALTGWLSRHRLTGRILVPGCGAGHDVRELSKDPEAEVIGLDLAPGAKTLAESFPRTGQETYLTGDFLAWPSAAGGGGYDALFEHTCFCAIEPDRRGDYARAAAGRLKPGGLFLAIFYRNPSHGGVDSPPYGCSESELDALFGGAFTLLLQEENLKTFEGREDREILRLMRRKA